MTPGGPAGDLERWAAEARARDAAEARARERWLRTQAEEEATLAGVLVEAAESASAVSILTNGGRVYAGPVRSVGRDFVALATPSAALTLVSLHSVAVLSPLGRDRRDGRPPAAAEDEPVGSRRGAELGVGLADVLAQAAGHRPRVSVDSGNQVVVGDLRTVGADVITIRTAGRTAGSASAMPPAAEGEAGPGLALIPTQSVSAISLLDSG